MFGGGTNRPLLPFVQLAPGRRGRLELRRHGRTLRALSVRGMRIWRIRPTGLPRGDYRVRVVVRGSAARPALTARRLARAGAPRLTG